MSERTAYPLFWPAGKPQTPGHDRRTNQLFKTSFADARDECFREIHRLGGSDPVVSTNVPLKRDGRPQAVEWGKAIAGHPGVAIYFKRKGKELCFACDCWNHVQDNMHAVTLTIAALRGIARWGTGDMMEAAFAGFRAIPEKTSGLDPWEVLGLDRNIKLTEDLVKSAFRLCAKDAHPDNQETGSAEKWAQLREAHDLLMATLRTH
jgi:hypothetical protein